jgi:4-coumarate--CoA ligase
MMGPVNAPGAGAVGLGSDGRGTDSLELVSLATALVEALHLHRSGIEDYLLARRTLGEWIEICAGGLARFDGALTFCTSGSTGKPKSCKAIPMSLKRRFGPFRSKGASG